MLSKNTTIPYAIHTFHLKQTATTTTQQNLQEPEMLFYITLKKRKLPHTYSPTSHLSCSLSLFLHPSHPHPDMIILWCDRKKFIDKTQELPLEIFCVLMIFSLLQKNAMVRCRFWCGLVFGYRKTNWNWQSTLFLHPNIPTFCYLSSHDLFVLQFLLPKTSLLRCLACASSKSFFSALFNTNFLTIMYGHIFLRDWFF